jgi:hypothetical protein
VRLGALRLKSMIAFRGILGRQRLSVFVRKHPKNRKSERCKFVPMK